MTFHKPYTGIFAYQGTIPSQSMNYINDNFPSILDKTGDNATNGGGISGRIDVLSGGEIKIASGGTLDVSSGGTFTINSGVSTNLTISSGSSFTVASGGSFTLASGSTSLLTGAKYDCVKLQLDAFSTGPNTLSATTGVVILVDTTSNAITFTLPATQNGRVFKFVDIGGNAATNNITIATPSTETIGGLTNDYVMDANGQGLELFADASSNWWILSTS
jgi:hypothetical protein